MEIIKVTKDRGKPNRDLLLQMTGTTTIKEASEVIGVSRSMIYRWIRDGISDRTREKYLKEFEEEQ